MYSLVVLEATSPNSRYQEGHAPSEIVGRILPCLFLVSMVTLPATLGMLWLVAAALQSLLLSPRTSLCVSLPVIRTAVVLDEGPYSTMASSYIGYFCKEPISK